MKEVETTMIKPTGIILLALATAVMHAERNAYEKELREQ